ncbi:hypothetical protein BZG36_05115 [Bifiguratus adelaidae]|uniref:Uncharacterized protein n=1 Tax=Bifiguratus adelaidae TaxID=1938954 RepID=A0A261XWC5_9FUNG|nr:hypothetical protein BZG36_05115 [Bifiguratus adelaidae]
MNYYDIPITGAEQDFEFVPQVQDPAAQLAVIQDYVNALPSLFLLTTIGGRPPEPVAETTEPADAADLGRGVTTETADSVNTPTVVSE